MRREEGGEGGGERRQAGERGGLVGTHQGEDITVGLGHIRGIGRAVYLPSRALINTLSSIITHFELIYGVLNIKYLMLDYKILLLVTLV